jgi:nicotinamidase-related amidase
LSNQRTPFKMLQKPIPLFDLTWDNIALILLDFQRLKVDLDGGVSRLAKLKGVMSEFKDYYVSTVDVVDNMRCILEKCRQLGIKIVFTRIASSSGDGMDIGDHTSIWGEGFPYSVEDEDLILPNTDGEWVIDKKCCNPFNCTDLEKKLRISDIRYLILCGAGPPECMQSTCYDAADRGFGVLFISDAVLGLQNSVGYVSGGLVKIRSTQSTLEMLDEIGV